MTGATLSIDPGFSLGWALFVGDDVLLNAGLVVAKPETGTELVAALNARRCQRLASDILSAVGGSGPRIDAMVMEGFAGARDFGAAAAQNQVLGVLSALALSWGVRIKAVSQQAVKKLAAGEIDFVRQEVKPRRARLRELRAALRGGAETDEIRRLEDELKPLERQRAKAEKDAMIAFAERRHPAFDVRKFGSKAEHVADAIAVYWTAKERGR